MLEKTVFVWKVVRLNETEFVCGTSVRINK